MVWKHEGFIMVKKTNIVRSDILDMSVYEKLRDKKRAEISQIKNNLLSLGAKKVEYIEIIDLKTLKKPKKNKFNLFFAFYIGKIRFIDNF